MTDKQIIIYKKECYNEPHCSLNQVLEQLEAYKMEAEEGKEINSELKAELTRANCQIADDEILQCDMREAIEELKAENKNWQKEYWKLEQGNDFLAETNSRLKQTLTEIKEIAEEAGNTQYLTFPDFNLKQNVKMLMGQFNGYLQQILQKISEVEDES